ncbi:MAG: PilZ domain-containing protein [Candidatus Xenobia bacterium]
MSKKTDGIVADSEDRRFVHRAPRVWHNVAAYCILGPHEVVRATIRNLSVSGVQLDVPRLIDLGKRLTIRISTEDSRNQRRAVVLTMLITGDVVWCRPGDEEGAPYSLGVRYLPMEKQELELVVRFFFEEFGIRLWEWSDKRRHVRVARSVGVSFRDADGVVRSGALRDVSVAGLGVISEQGLPMGHETVFRFTFGEGQEFDCLGRVVRCQKSGRNYDLGVSFERLDDMVRDNLIRAVIRLFQEGAPEV